MSLNPPPGTRIIIDTIAVPPFHYSYEIIKYYVTVMRENQSIQTIIVPGKMDLMWMLHKDLPNILKELDRKIELHNEIHGISGIG